MNTPRLIKIGDALSQLANVTFLPKHRETTANESISGRSYRMRWTRIEKIIDWFFYPWEKNHCKRAYEKDLERAQELLNQASGQTTLEVFDDRMDNTP